MDSLDNVQKDQKNNPEELNLVFVKIDTQLSV